MYVNDGTRRGKGKVKHISSEINQLKYVVNTIYLILYSYLKSKIYLVRVRSLANQGGCLDSISVTYGLQVT